MSAKGIAPVHGRLLIVETLNAIGGEQDGVLRGT